MHDNIDSIEKKSVSGVPGGTIIIKCKDFRTIQLTINFTGDFLNVATSVERLASIGNSLFILFLLINNLLYSCYDDVTITLRLRYS